MSPSEIYEELKNRLGDKVLELSEGVDDPFIKIASEAIVETCFSLRNDDKLAFDSLMCLSGVDYPQHITIVYHLFSFRHRQKIVLKTEVSKDNPILHTVEEIWKAANWHEREIYDLFGVVFDGHSDLRRILLPDDWEGHPLRKDYQTPEFYQGIRVPKTWD